ncbi:Acetyl esterase/lipase [Streptomyces sp. 2112.3]|uniref:alpha/beta hydrolase n=1 Tax=Streptomyces sp. 2112.3 TaxID=1881023 RepID=UPI00089A9E52|nr:alpha/beta hydrolase [Streptomyces sp. 2112.3]SEE62456.1 Acetyl esterase/lipase [Streptomyces sp. 2112.3]
MSVQPEMNDRTAARVHPELVPAYEALPRVADPYEDIEAARAAFHDMLAAFPADRTGVCSERFDIPRTVGGAPADGGTLTDGGALTVEVYRPEEAVGTAAEDTGIAGGAGNGLPAVLHFHGGGFALGRALPGQDRVAIELCRELPAVIVTVEYRLAPEHRYPAAVEDCYLALEWVAGRAAELGIDPARIAVAGKSAGGGLSAAVALMARDRGGPELACQSLCVPDLDDRVGADAAAGTAADTEGALDARVLNGRGVQSSWRHYLPEGTTVAEAYAAPARATELSGLPPAHVLVCDLDPMREAGLAYARRLMDAGVPVTVRNVPGAWHGFELYAPDTRVAKEMTAHWTGQLRAALHPASPAVV